MFLLIAESMGEEMEEGFGVAEDDVYVLQLEEDPSAVMPNVFGWLAYAWKKFKRFVRGR